MVFCFTDEGSDINVRCEYKSSTSFFFYCFLFTTILITHATQYFSLADYIIVPDTESHIAQQGSWSDMRSELDTLKEVVEQPVKAAHEPSVSAEQAVANPQKGIDEAEKDLKRKTGDYSVYSEHMNGI